MAAETRVVRDATPQDGERIAEIYNHAVINEVATFETEAVSADEMRTRMKTVQAQFCWLVCEVDNRVIGYAYAGPWKARAAYRHSVETSVYIDPACHGQGAGSALYEELLRRLRAFNVHAVIGGIAGDNAASVRLHERFGFVPVGRLKEVGFKFDTWIDVSYYQLIL